MIDFDLTEEQRLLEQSVREWGAREVAPQIQRSRSRAPLRPRAILPQMARARAARRLGAAEYGGAGMDYICLGLAARSSSTSTRRCA